MSCGHACAMYAGTEHTSNLCCECLHTDTAAPTIYIDGLGEQRCPRWQFYCSACVCRCAPDGATMWDAGKMRKVDVFLPGTRELASKTPLKPTQTEATDAAPAPWIQTARQTMRELALATDA